MPVHIARSCPRSGRLISGRSFAFLEPQAALKQGASAISLFVPTDRRLASTSKQTIVAIGCFSGSPRGPLTYRPSLLPKRTTITTHRLRVEIMPPRGRYVAFGSDDDESEYITLPLPSVEGRSSSRLRVVVDEDRRPSPSRRAERQKVYHAHSYQAAPQTAVEPDGIFVEGLHVPQSRPRASSTGARPHPNYLPRERSRTRVKHYHHDHYDYSDESSDDIVCKPSHRRHKRDSSFNGGRLSPDTLKKLAKLELLERQQSTDPAVAAQLAKLQAMEEKRTREDEEAKLIARMEDRERREKQKEEQLLREYREKQRQKDAEEKAFYAEAEAKRLKREVEAKAESDRLIALQKEKDAKAKADRLRIIAEEKARIKKEEEEAEEERKRIVLEEKAKEEKEKLKREALKKQILAEEEQKKKEEKEKKQKEEEEFQQKVKERFMKAGRLYLC